MIAFRATCSAATLGSAVNLVASSETTLDEVDHSRVLTIRHLNRMQRAPNDPAFMRGNDDCRRWGPTLLQPAP